MIDGFISCCGWKWIYMLINLTFIIFNCEIIVIETILINSY